MPTPETYRISLSSRAGKETRKLDRQTLARVAKAIDSLTNNPRPPGCLKVKSAENLWRIRVGDWRIGYEVDGETRTVTIITVGLAASFTIERIHDSFLAAGRRASVQ
jgi:mRNA interferase RelE/StbE